MSNLLRVKQGNLSKVKYFLPHYKQPSCQHVPKQQCSRPSKNPKKKSSPNIHTKSLDENAQISFQIVGISEGRDLAKNNEVNKENLLPLETNVPKKYSASKISHVRKGTKLPQNSIEASLASIRALSNSQDWVIPEGVEHEQFLKFIQTLKNDDSYQRTITMFTIMYFYEKKRNR